MAERYRNIRHHFTREIANLLFMRAIGVRVHKANSNRFDALLFQIIESRFCRGYIQGANFFALCVHAATNGDCIFQSGQWRWLGPDNPRGKTAGHIRPGDLHDIAISFRDDQADARAFTFKHGIGRHRGSMEKIFDACRIYASVRANRVDAVQNALAAVMRRRRRFVPPKRASLCIEQQQVGKSPADIHAQTIPH